jgi:hypothetical protein
MVVSGFLYFLKQPTSLYLDVCTLFCFVLLLCVADGNNTDMSGFEVGTLEIHSMRVHSLHVVVLSGSVAIAAGPGSTSTTGNESASSDGGELVYSPREPICLPIIKRHQVPVRFDLRSSSGGIIPKQGGTIAQGTLWLRKLVDGELEKVEVPLWSEQWRR